MRFRPIRGLQRWLKRIRYNSAHNQRTPWQKAGDWWLLIALPCAFGVMLIGNHYPVKLTREAICTIRLGKVEQNAPLEAWIERDKDDPWAIGIPFGSVNVYTLELNYGWPLSTGSINKNYGFRLSTFNPDDNLKFPILTPDRYSQHPLVIDAVISALRAERLGEVAFAFVVADSNASLDVEAILTWSKENMANYKIPRKIEIVEDLPVNASGKVQKNRLRAICSDFLG